MKRNSDMMNKYVVFDLEWNQSPGGKGKTLKRLPFEIIEIGAVRLDQNFAVEDVFHRLIRPRVYRQLHYINAEVTHLNMKELKQNGVDFAEAASEFFRWCGADVSFCTWGTMDLTELQRNMDFFGVENALPWPLFYFDVQKLYSLSLGDGRKPSLDAAVEELGLSANRSFHRALNDAWYTGQILARLGSGKVMAYRSIDYYCLPPGREQEIHVTFPTYAKYVSRAFASREDAMKDKGVTETRCYRCGRALRKKIRWFTPNQKIYYCLTICPEHGYMKGKIRIKKTDAQDRIFVVKTLKLTDGEGAAAIAERRDAYRKKRAERRRKMS
ncbi:MAG: exonuclease domain-containing protein [Clostridiales bacterium]|nr:exonuclease domain-containing protein [Clostridiales bacterium]